VNLLFVYGHPENRVKKIVSLIKEQQQKRTVKTGVTKILSPVFSNNKKHDSNDKE